MSELFSDEKPSLKIGEDKFILEDAPINPLPLDSVVRGDALEIMRAFPTSSIALIVIDPPYSHFHKGSLDATLGDFKILEVFFDKLAEQCKRVLRSTGSAFVFCDFRTYASVFYGFYEWLTPTNLIVWRKDYLGPGVRFRPLHECILYLTKKKTPPPKDRNITDIWDAPRIKVPNKIHPFQKPKELYRIMIQNCTNERDIVLEPFCGSGPAICVAKELNRHWIGIDIKPRFCELANREIKKVPEKLDEFMTIPEKESVEGWP